MNFTDRKLLIKATLSYYLALIYDILDTENPRFIYRCVYCGRKTAQRAFLVPDDKVYPECCGICAVTPGETSADNRWVARPATEWEKKHLPPFVEMTDEEVETLKNEVLGK
jgi:hypothetical protein